MKRLEYLDQIKGIAIFLMVMGHVILFTFRVENCTIEKMFFFNMPAFFYVSGYLLYKETDNVKELVGRLRHKAARLLPPWITVTVVMAGYMGWGFFNTLCIFYWFFYVLFLLTLIIIVLDFNLFRHLKNPYVYCIALMSVPAVSAVLKFMGYSGYLPAPWLCMYSLPFLLGWVCRKYDKVNDFILNNQILFVIAFAIFILTWYKADVVNNYIKIVAAIAGIIVVQSLLYHREVAGKKMAIVSKIGTSSLAIYALNNFFLPDLNGGGNLFAGRGLVLEIIAIGAVTIAVIACCIAVETVFHNNKYLSKKL